MSSLQPVRGTHDILPDEARRHRHVANTAREVAARYGFGEMATPIFEFTDVFARTLGDTSDIVTKEMYRFTDKGGDDLCLRPEGTAGVARALISGGLAQDLPLKYFYHGPMFRYERPQKGRLRQFHQFGVELMGVPEPQGDIEIISMGAAILEALGVLDDTTLELNTLGSSDSRARYRDALVAYLSNHTDALSDDSKTRLTRNPLRILDSKDDGDRSIIEDAPHFGDYLDDESTTFFGAVRAGLDALGISYTLNPRLVRGLDYYCHTAFEFTTQALGAQGTVLAGGRYDGLIATMGGPDTPGVGFAAGIERLAMLIADAPAPRRPIAIVPVGNADSESARTVQTLADQLRRALFTVDVGYRGNVGKRMKRANKLNASAALLLGEDEIARNVVSLRDLDSGEQQEIPLDEIESRLAPYR